VMSQICYSEGPTFGLGDNQPLRSP
jgi:hypothetical protein